MNSGLVGKASQPGAETPAGERRGRVWKGAPCTQAWAGAPGTPGCSLSPGQRRKGEQAPARRYCCPSVKDRAPTGRARGDHSLPHPLPSGCLMPPMAKDTWKPEAQGPRRQPPRAGGGGQTAARGRVGSRAEPLHTSVRGQALRHFPKEGTASERARRGPVPIAHVQGHPRLCPSPAATRAPEDPQKGPRLVSTCAATTNKDGARQHGAYSRHTSPRGRHWGASGSL